MMKTRTLLILILLLGAGLSGAQVIHVPADQPSIQDGIIAANEGDTVLVAENTYYENIRFMGKAITVASEYILDGDSSHIVNTIIDGGYPVNSDSAATVMFLHGEDSTSILQGFTITGGKGVYNKGLLIRWGGGIFLWNAGGTIRDNIIKDNHVTDLVGAGGAGLACGLDSGEHWIIIKENYIGYNTSTAHGPSAFGGGLFLMSNCIIENNLIEYNTCTNTAGMADGGGIEVECPPGHNPVTLIKGNIIRYNQLNAQTRALGAGINVYELSATIVDNLINDNTAECVDQDARGGGVFIRMADKAIIENNEIINNSISGSTCWGGGLYAYNSDTVEIIDNSILNNECQSTDQQAGGGGINLLRCTEIIISGNEILGNSTASVSGYNSWGGGILVDKAQDTVYILENIIQNNAAGTEQNGYGGGIVFYNETDIVAYITANRIIANSSDYRGGGFCSRNAYRTYFENNLFKDNASYRYGGAIMLYETFDTVNPEVIPHPVIINNTFIHNTSEYGGAIASVVVEEIPIVVNSIFWQNVATYSPDLYSTGGDKIPVYNNIIDTSAILTPWMGEGNLNCDPTFMNDTLHLHWNSDCLNSGRAMLTFNEVDYYCPDKDIDGDPRPYENTDPDIGADEAPYLYVVSGELTVTQENALQVVPNPVMNRACLKYHLNEAGLAEIFIFNESGKLVSTLLSEYQPKGLHELTWEPGNLPLGTFFCVLKTEKVTQSVKVIKIR